MYVISKKESSVDLNVQGHRYDKILFNHTHHIRHRILQQHCLNIAYKNRKHGEQNPRAGLQKAPTKEKIKERELCHPIYSGMAAPTSDGGAAAIVCNKKFLEKNGLESRAVEIVAQHMVTDMPSSFGQSFMDLSGYRQSY